ncbi:MAG: DUF1697 domain-containing protein [Pseudorhodobacter sp.]|nr:MAG: DUF1697 domain-containing protein [Pseudorhodobacter sp.]
MKKVLLLRGVNVGGANRLPMPEFRTLLAELGLGQVETHLQSGNAVFDDPGVADLPAKIAAQMRLRFGFAPAMILLDAPAHAALVAGCPYTAEAAADPTSVHVWYLAAPLKADLGPVMALAKDERLTQADAALYLHAPGGIGRSALVAKLERLLSSGATARNWRSVQAIAALLAA